MMPEECANIRSIARWVLPVLVGPRTAVTPTPRARASRGTGEENETGINCFGQIREPPSGRRGLSCALQPRGRTDAAWDASHGAGRRIATASDSEARNDS